MNEIGQIIAAMMDYYAGDVRRINHFLKVYGFAKSIGELEGLETNTQKILEVTAVMHDIGIKNSEMKYNSASGVHQQTEGPPEAEKLLKRLGVDDAVIDRVCWLISRHHTYTDIQGSDYQILLEADFLVNAFEDELSPTAIRNFAENIFRTKTGKAFLDTIYQKK